MFKLKRTETATTLKSFKSLKTNKGSGLDNTTCRLLKSSADLSAPSLTYIFNLSLSTGTFPQEWKTAKVVPLHKSGPPDQVNNYRPISILPVVSKILEKEVHKQLYSYLIDNNLLNPCQHGFRSKRSTHTALINVVDQWLNSIDKGQVTAVVFLDLSKAFDSVKHDILKAKLQVLGVNGIDLEWYNSYLSCCNQRVCYNGVLSSPKPITIGVPQGSALGPLLLLAYVNDLPKSIAKSSINMSADDTAIYYSASDTKAIEDVLNADLSNLSVWIQSNGLALNIK